MSLATTTIVAASLAAILGGTEAASRLAATTAYRQTTVGAAFLPRLAEYEPVAAGMPLLPGPYGLLAQANLDRPRSPDRAEG